MYVEPPEADSWALVTPEINVSNALVGVAVAESNNKPISDETVDFPFGLEDVDESEGNLQKTMTMLSSFVDKPKIKKKLLERPPFRFLYNVIVSVMKSKNYRTELFSQTTGPPSRAGIGPFLDKIIQAVSEDMRMHIEMDPEEGKCHHNTRTFL